MVKNVLVTGGIGFIGSNVVRQLADKKYRITVLDNFSLGYMENIEGIPNVEVIKGDIRDKDIVNKAMKGKDGIFHLAALTGNVKSIENPIDDAEVNVLGTLNILNAAREHKVPKVVASSSGAIFGEVAYLPVDEAHPCEPDSPYGVSKLATEKYCLAYSRIYDIDIVCLRYFNVYGTNQRFDPYGNVIPIWTGLLLKGQPLKIYGTGEQTRDFINVQDVAMANVRAFETPGIRGAYNIGTGRSITISELGEKFRRVASRDIEIVHEPARKGEVMHSQATIEKARKEFGFDPQIGLEEGLREYIEWIKTLG